MAEAGVYARTVAELDRAVQVGIASGRIISVSFPPEPPSDADPDHAILDRIGAYLAGEADDFGDVTIGLTVPTDQRRVLETLRSVPYGESVTVERLARMTPALDGDDPADRSLVETALTENPVPLLIPDHRVTDGPHASPRDVVEVLRDLEGF